MAESQDGDTKAECNTAGPADHSKRAARGADFYLYVFKVKPCFRTYPHCWSSCPYVHPGEKARRRDPKRYAYSPVPCPHDSKGGERCPQGDSCNFTHNVYEFHLHPMRFRTALCQDRQSCNRQLCFFAHSAEELRRPSMAAEPPELPPFQHTAQDLSATAVQTPAGAGLYAWPAVPGQEPPTAPTDVRTEQGAVTGGWAMHAGQGSTAAAAGSRQVGAASIVEPRSDVLTVLTNFRQRHAAAAAAAGAGPRPSEDAGVGMYGNASGVATPAGAAEVAPSYASSVHSSGQQLGYGGGGYGGSSVPQMVLLDRQQQVQQQQQQRGELVPAFWANTGYAGASGDAGQDAAGLQPVMYNVMPQGGTALLTQDNSRQEYVQLQHVPAQHMASHQHQQQQLQAMQGGYGAFDAATPVLQSHNQQTANQEWQGKQLLQMQQMHQQQMQQQQQYDMADFSTGQGAGYQQQQYPAAGMLLRPQQHVQRQGVPGMDPIAGHAAAAGPSYINYGHAVHYAAAAFQPAAAAGGSSTGNSNSSLVMQSGSLQAGPQGQYFQPSGAGGSTGNSNSSLVMQPGSLQAGPQGQYFVREQGNTFSGPLMVAAPTSGTLSAPLMYRSAMLPSQGISGTLSAVDGSTGLSAEALAGVLHQLSMYECSVEDL